MQLAPVLFLETTLINMPPNLPYSQPTPTTVLVEFSIQWEESQQNLFTVRNKPVPATCRID